MSRRARNLWAVTAGATLLVVGVVIAVVVIGSSDSGDGSKRFKPGAPAPAATIKLLNGKNLSLEKVRGKEAVVLGFFLDNCEPCIKGMRNFAEVAGELQDEPVSVVALNLGPSGPDALASFGSEIGAAGFDIGEQTSGPNLPQELGVTAVDTNVVIDRNGRVLATEVFMPKEDQVAAARQSLPKS